MDRDVMLLACLVLAGVAECLLKRRLLDVLTRANQPVPVALEGRPVINVSFSVN